MKSKHTKAGRKARRRAHHAAGWTVPMAPFGAQASPGAVRLLWHCGYYDAPLNGMCRYRGEDLWFYDVDQNKAPWRYDWFRRYAMVRLSAEELAEERRWHDLFREHVGHHTDYNERGRRVGLTHDRADSRKFFDAAVARAPRNYKSNPVVGWFQR